MQNNFSASLAAVLISEGGYVNNPHDPGGATNKGITQRTYDAWRTKQGRSVNLVGVISSAEVAAIYKAEYWDAIQGDLLPAGVDYAVFDYAVNSGPSRALYSYTTHKNIDGICDERLAFLKALSSWQYFGKGWSTRIAQVRALAKKMASQPTTPIPATVQPIGVPTMSILPSQSTVSSSINIGSIVAMFSGLSLIIPSVLKEYSTVGLIGAAALIVGALIQAFIPPATAKAVIGTVTDTVIPLVEQFDPALKPLLEQVRDGLRTAASGASTASNAVAAIAATPAPLVAASAVVTPVS